jgi:lipopolysaccharide export system protein LptA
MYGQEVVTVTGDSLIGKRVDGKNIREVIGNVVMTQGDVTITCNRAIQYLSDNEAELIGDVVATKDTVILKTKKGYYYGDTKTAYSKSGVKLIDGKMTLTAQNGYYYYDEDRAYFYENVQLEDSSRKLVSKRLNYLKKPNKLIAGGNVMITDFQTSIYSDSLIHFRDSKKTFAYKNVQVSDPAENLVIRGNKLEDLPPENLTNITGNTLLSEIDTTDSGKIDTLLISAKKLRSENDSVKKFVAIDSVKIVRGVFASVNDSTVLYRDTDQIITVKSKKSEDQPILWYENSQLTGDSVFINLNDNELESINVKENAFLLSELPDYNFRYNQLSGKRINMHFENQELRKTEVFENVLSIYYLFEEGDANGLIKSSAKNAEIIFSEGKVDQVKLYGTPESEFHPEHLIKGKGKDFTLPSFIVFDKRPTKRELLSKWELN